MSKLRPDELACRWGSKRCYESRIAADAAAAKVLAGIGLELVSYRCPHCPYFHLTKSQAARRRAEEEARATPAGSKKAALRTHGRRAGRGRRKGSDNRRPRPRDGGDWGD